jgi:hypothetical protein
MYTLLHTSSRRCVELVDHRNDFTFYVFLLCKMTFRCVGLGKLKINEVRIGLCT